MMESSKVIMKMFIDVKILCCDEDNKQYDPIEDTVTTGEMWLDARLRLDSITIVKKSLVGDVDITSDGCHYTISGVTYEQLNKELDDFYTNRIIV
jgi:hypothetical protein